MFLVHVEISKHGVKEHGSRNTMQIYQPINKFPSSIAFKE